jgi:uncharacterized protein (TIGR03067 family)
MPEPHPIEGRWQMIRAELAGEAAPEMFTSKTELEFAAGTYTVRYDGEITDRGTFLITNVDPVSTMTLAGIEGPNADRRIPCIFQLVGERLRICFGLDGKMPNDFSATSAEKYLAAYRRKETVRKAR